MKARNVVAAFSVAALAALMLAEPGVADTGAGLAAFDRGDYRAALAALRPEAEGGDNQAQFVMGVIYLHGLGVEPSPEKAARSAPGGPHGQLSDLPDSHPVSTWPGALTEGYKRE